MAQIHYFYSLQFVTCPVSYQASTQGPIDNEYLKIQKNQLQLAKNGCKIMPIQQLQANTRRITQEHIIKLPGMKKKQCFSPMVQERKFFQLNSRPKIFHFSDFLVKKIKKMAHICHINCLDLLLIKFVIFPVLYHSAYWVILTRSTCKSIKMGQKRQKTATKLHLSSNCKQIVCK